jgi:hypothetical protein
LLTWTTAPLLSFMHPDPTSPNQGDFNSQ